MLVVTRLLALVISSCCVIVFSPLWSCLGLYTLRLRHSPRGFQEISSLAHIVSIFVLPYFSPCFFRSFFIASFHLLVGTDMEPLLYNVSQEVCGLKCFPFACRFLTGVALRIYRATPVRVRREKPSARSSHIGLNFSIFSPLENVADAKSLMPHVPSGFSLRRCAARAECV